MIKKVAILIIGPILLYVLSFLLVVSAPFGVMDYADWDDRIMVIEIYSPIFDTMHHCKPVRHALFNICSLTGSLENYALLYGANEIYMVDVYFDLRAD